MNLRNIVLDHPDSERGPRICLDDEEPFTANNQKRTFAVTPSEDRPMRITLVWTDAPGAANSSSCGSGSTW